MHSSTQAGTPGATQELLTVNEAAALLRVSSALLYRRPDLIPGSAVKLGSMIRFRASTIRAALGLEAAAR